MFSGIGKTRAEIRRALDVGIRCFNVESLAELDVLSEVAQACGPAARISIRVNPNVDARTHPYISTGLKGNKFGIGHEQALAAYRHAARLPGLQVVGIDCHIGSQITEVAPYLEAMERVLDLVAAIEAAGIAIHHIDFGGGLGIDYAGETPPAADALWPALLARLDARGYGDRPLLIEPGRSLVGNAGVCLTEVLYLKPGEQKNFCIVDAAMNDLPRPALYEAFTASCRCAWPRPTRRPSRMTWWVPCAKAATGSGAIARWPCSRASIWRCSAGAYCMSMASNYNTRPRAAEVLVDGREARVVRQREAVQDLWRGETA